MTTDIIASAQNGLARLTLNRPSALHALTTEMCAAMTEALLKWKDDPAVKAIQIDHADGTRGFCAGGDIRMLADSGKSDGKAAREFFHKEYRLNHLLMVYPKPIIALMDGVTMGGGVGLAMPAPFRIATERTTFSMPESGIGLFPDVGGGWHLPRLPGKIGLWLALTGARIKAADCIAAGIATHYMPSEILEAAKAQIAGAAQTHDPARALASGLEALSEPAGRVVELTPDNRSKIDKLFAGESVEAIVAALEADGSDWAKAQLKTMAAKSPSTMKVSLRQLALGEKMTSFDENMRMEYRIGARIVMTPDFHEGVRAVIVDKDNAPRWSPVSLTDVSETSLNAIFAPLPAQEEWTPLPALA